MSAWWLISYAVLWALMIAAGLVILALAREVETLHRRLDSLYRFISSPDVNEKAEKPPPANPQQVLDSSGYSISSNQTRRGDRP